MADPKNIPPEIEAAIAQGREMGLREAARWITGLKQVRIAYVIRNLGDRPPCDAEGWSDLTHNEAKIRDGIAAGVLRLIDGSKAPPCSHTWHLGSSQVCAICGAKRPND